MNRRVRVGAALTALGLATVMVAGCGGDDGSVQGSSDTTSGTLEGESGATAGDSGVGSERDVWTGELEDGSQLTVRLRVGADDPAVAPFEAFRQAAGGPDVVWIVGEVAVPADVAGGTGSGRFVTLVVGDADPFIDDPTDSNDGVTTAEFACSKIQDWLGAAPADDALAAYTDLYNGACAGNTLAIPAAAGTTTTYVLAHPAPLPAFDTMLAGLAIPLSPG